MRVDLHILSDSKFVKLQRRLSKEEFRQAFALYVELLLQAHAQNTREVIEDWCEPDDQVLLEHLRGAGLLDEVGIPEGPWAEWQHADRRAFESEMQSEKGKARAAGAARGPGGHFLPAGNEPGGEPGTSREPGTVRYGNGTVRSSPLVEGSDSTNDEVSLTEEQKIYADATDLFAELTGQPYPLNGPHGRLFQNLVLAPVQKWGWQAWSERVRLVAGRFDGPKPDAEEILFSVKDSLRRRIETADVQKDERRVEIEDDHRKRLDRTQLTLHGYGQHSDGPDAHPGCPACRGEVAV